MLFSQMILCFVFIDMFPQQRLCIRSHFFFFFWILGIWWHMSPYFAQGANWFRKKSFSNGTSARNIWWCKLGCMFMSTRLKYHRTSMPYEYSFKMDFISFSCFAGISWFEILPDWGNICSVLNFTFPFPSQESSEINKALNKVRHKKVLLCCIPLCENYA